MDDEQRPELLNKIDSYYGANEVPAFIPESPKMKTDRLCIIGLVLALLIGVLCLIGFLWALPVGIISLILSIIAFSGAKKDGHKGKAVAISSIVISSIILIAPIGFIAMIFIAAIPDRIDLRNDNFVNEYSFELNQKLGDWELIGQEDVENTIGSEFGATRVKSTNYTINFNNHYGGISECVFSTANVRSKAVVLDWESCSDSTLNKIVKDDISQKLPAGMDINENNFLLFVDPGRCCGYSEIVLNNDLLWPKNINLETIKNSELKLFARFYLDKPMWPQDLSEMIGQIRGYGFTDLSIQISASANYYLEFDFYQDKFSKGWLTIDKDGEKYYYGVKENYIEKVYADNVIWLETAEDLINLRD